MYSVNIDSTRKIHCGPHDFSSEAACRTGSRCTGQFQYEGGNLHSFTSNSYPKSLPDLTNLFQLKELII